MENVLRPLLRPDGADCHSCLGFLITGGRIGPCLLVTPPVWIITPLADALARALRHEEVGGRLALAPDELLLRQDARGAWLRGQIGPVDATLALYAQSATMPDAGPLRAVLAKAATLHMIAARNAWPDDPAHRQDRLQTALR